MALFKMMESQTEMQKVELPEKAQADELDDFLCLLDEIRPPEIDMECSQRPEDFH